MQMVLARLTIIFMFEKANWYIALQKKTMQILHLSVVDCVVKYPFCLRLNKQK